MEVRKRGAPRRVFVGLVEVAGFYGRLAEGFREIGIEATLVDLSPNPFGYDHGPSPLVVRLAKRTARERATRTGAGPRAAWRLAHRLSLVLLLLWAVTRHDAFIFGYRSTFLWFLELPLLKLLGRRVVFVFNGSDARPSYIDGADLAAGAAPEASRATALTRRKLKEIRRIERWADQIVAHPLYTHLFTRETAGIQSLGLPAPPSVLSSPLQPARPSNSVRIVHAPSDPAVKGTEVIRQAISELIRDGQPVELIELHGVPNAEVQRALETCDFVVDQVYSDLPMSVFALEAALHAKPAVVGSYGWDLIETVIPPQHRAPVEACHPGHLVEGIRRLVIDAEYRGELGERAREFAASWAAAEVARRYEQLAFADPDPTWMSPPSACRYIYGVGLPAARAQEVVRAILRESGREGLVLDGRPDLEEAFVAFAARRDLLSADSKMD